MKFAPSVSQIFRRIFNSKDEAIKVQEVKSNAEESDFTLQMSLLKDILNELKIMNLHLSIVTDEKISNNDIE